MYASSDQPRIHTAYMIIIYNNFIYIIINSNIYNTVMSEFNALNQESGNLKGFKPDPKRNLWYAARVLPASADSQQSTACTQIGGGGGGGGGCVDGGGGGGCGDLQPPFFRDFRLKARRQQGGSCASNVLATIANMVMVDPI